MSKACNRGIGDALTQEELDAMTRHSVRAARADEAFLKLLEAAHPDRVVTSTRPGTEHPRMMQGATRVTIPSSSGWDN